DFSGGGIVEQPGTNFLIRVYYLYRTNMPRVFEALFNTLLTSSKDLALLPSVKDQDDLIKKLAETMIEAFPVPDSMITLRLGGEERLLLNAIQRVYGYSLPMEKYPVSTTVNSSFHNTIDSIFRNIALGIIGGKSMLLDFKNPGGLLELMIALQRSLLTNETNMVNLMATKFNMVCTRYLELLKNDLLMSSLGIVGAGIDQRLIAMGRKLHVPVVRNPLVFFDLAEIMSNFINKVETTNWTIAEASNMYEGEKNIASMKLTLSAYKEVWGIDYMGLAMNTIRQSISTPTPPVQTYR
ncbi:MAG TPA: hypothetical protein VFD60_00380, partial [Nitrososphaeraceae archaeon]|nr:hypothetical protein [Nitrososphaeraceae archaeon]